MHSPRNKTPFTGSKFPCPARTSARASLSLSLGQARLPYTEGYKTAGRLSRMLTCLPCCFPLEPRERSWRHRALSRATAVRQGPAKARRQADCDSADPRPRSNTEPGPRPVGEWRILEQQSVRAGAFRSKSAHVAPGTEINPNASGYMSKVREPLDGFALNLQALEKCAAGCRRAAGTEEVTNISVVVADDHPFVLRGVSDFEMRRPTSALLVHAPMALACFRPSAKRGRTWRSSVHRCRK